MSALNTIGIRQTSEVLAAIGSLWHDANAANADGKFTKLEAFKLGVSNLGEVIAACSGISEVPAELADIQPEEMDALYFAFVEKVGWQEHTQSRDVFNILFNFLFHAVNTWRLLENTLHPPKAIAVHEIEGVDPP